MFRGRRTQAALVVASLLVLVGCGSGDGEGPEGVDPLVGLWDTGPVDIQQVRETLAEAGYTDAEIDGFFTQFGLKEAAALQFRINFYREDDQPFAYQQAWDPATGGPPSDADHGPYEILPSSEVAITSADPEVNQYRYVFAYDVADETLELRLVSSENPGVSEEELRVDNAWQYASTAAPFHLIDEG